MTALDAPGDYHAAEVVGEDGELSVTFTARRADGGPDVLLTVYQLTVEDPSSRRRLRSAWSVGERLTGLPGILAPVETGFTEAGRPYFVTAHPGGAPLSASSDDRRPMTVEEAVKLGTDLATLLAAVHHRGVLHLDVRPENVWTDEAGGFALRGMGMLRALRTVCNVAFPATALVHPPRELFGWQTPSRATDVHLLGSTLHRILSTSQDPDIPLDEAQAYQRALRTTSVRLERTDVPKGLAALLERMLAGDSAARPSLSEVYQALAGLPTGVIGVGALPEEESTPEPEEEAAAQPEPEHEPAAHLEPQPEPGLEPAAESAPEPEPESDPEAEAAPEPEPEPVLEAKTEAVPEPEPEPELAPEEAEPEAAAPLEPEPEQQAAAPLEPEPELAPEAEPETAAPLEPESEQQAAAPLEPAPEPEADAEPQLEPEAEAAPTAEATPEPEADLQAPPGPVPDPDPEAQTESALEPDRQPEPYLDSGPTHLGSDPTRRRLAVLAVATTAILAAVVSTVALTAGEPSRPLTRAAVAAGPTTTRGTAAAATDSSTPPSSAPSSNAAAPASSAPKSSTATSPSQSPSATDGTTDQNDGAPTTAQPGSQVTSARPVGSPTGKPPAPPTSKAPPPPPKQPTVFTYEDGASCGTGLQLTMTWYDLAGSDVDGCGDGQTRTQKGNGANADWIFNIPADQSCVFQLYIPDDSAITSQSVNYQLFISVRDHADANRLDRHFMDQTDERGQWITFNSTPYSSPNGVFDLQLHDSQDTGDVQVADAAKAICS